MVGHLDPDSGARPGQAEVHFRVGMKDGVGHQFTGEQGGLVGQLHTPPAAQGRGNQATGGAGALGLGVEPGGHPPVSCGGERQIRVDDRAPTPSSGRLTGSAFLLEEPAVFAAYAGFQPSAAVPARAPATGS